MSQNPLLTEMSHSVLTSQIHSPSPSCVCRLHYGTSSAGKKDGTRVLSLTNIWILYLYETLCRWTSNPVWRGEKHAGVITPYEDNFQSIKLEVRLKEIWTPSAKCLCHSRRAELDFCPRLTFSSRLFSLSLCFSRLSSFGFTFSFSRSRSLSLSLCFFSEGSLWSLQ